MIMRGREGTGDPDYIPIYIYKSIFGVATMFV